jgi:hypothetical protein
MRRWRPIEDHGQNLEILASLMMIRFVILALVLVFLAPREEVKTSDSRDRGNIRIEVVWENNKDVDVDLWVQSPGDVPVGWNNKNGKVFDLVRDDLGNVNNPSGIHYEVVYGRGMPPGEYVVNLHLYANREPNYPIVPVKAIVSFGKDDSGKGGKQDVYSREVFLTEVGQEITVVRFTIKANSELDSDSITTVYKPLYKARR